MPKTETTPTLAELKQFIRVVRKFKDFESYVRNEELFYKVLKWLKEKSYGK
jgi:hypothetical protein